MGQQVLVRIIRIYSVLFEMISNQDEKKKEEINVKIEPELTLF